MRPFVFSVLFVFVLICVFIGGFFLAGKADDPRFIPCSVEINGEKHIVYVAFLGRFDNDVEYSCLGKYNNFTSKFICCITDKDTVPGFFSWFSILRNFYIRVEASFLDNGIVRFHCTIKNFSPANRKGGSILQKIILEKPYPDLYRVLEDVAGQVFYHFNPPLDKAEKEK